MTETATHLATENEQDLTASREFYETLVASEWTTPVRLAQFQEETLRRYLAHVIENVPYHRDRLAALITAKGGLDLRRWFEVPIMTRDDIEHNSEKMFPDEIPAAHGRILRVLTSGSTGRPITLRKTELHTTALSCSFFRLGTAFQIDWNKDLISIRAYDSVWRGPHEPTKRRERWGPPWLTGQSDGNRYHMSVHTAVKDQIAYLRQKPAAYVNTSAYNAMVLAAEMAHSSDKPPEISAILTVGEYVSEDLREECRTHLNCEIIDAFSTAECGTLVTQCPEGDGYHMQPELNVLEVLKPDGTPCGPGETGLITVTPLYNYAMPLVRYQSEDLVTVGGPCACGRPAPVLSKLHGRVEHQFITSNGDYMRPEPEVERMRGFIGRRRWQLVQTGQETAKLHFMDDAHAAPIKTDEMVNYLEGLLPRNIKVTAKAVCVLGPSSGGKFAAVSRSWTP